MIEFFGEEIALLNEKALFLPKLDSLIIADVHLGKSQHFRKSGIPVPSQIGIADLDSISQLIETYAPSQLIFAGDFFHSSENQELSLIEKWKNYHSTDIVLVVGNHDVYAQQKLSEIGFLTYESYPLGNVLICHDVVDFMSDKNSIVIGGHLHPAVRLLGMGKQNVKLPCFYIEENRIILPSFGTFTGSHLVEINSTSSLFAVTKTDIFTVSNHNPFLKLLSNA